MKLARYEPGEPKILLVIKFVLVKNDLSLILNVKRDKTKKKQLEEKLMQTNISKK